MRGLGNSDAMLGDSWASRVLPQTNALGVGVSPTLLSCDIVDSRSRSAWCLGSLSLARADLGHVVVLR